MQTIKQLELLQELDLALDADRRKYNENKQALAVPQALKKLQKQIEHAKMTVTTSQKERRRQEDAVAELTATIKAKEESLYGGRIKEPREQVALQQNIENLKQHLKKLEDDALEALMEQEQAEALLKAFQKSWEEGVAAFKKHRAQLEKDQKKIVKHARALKARREKLIVSIPAAMLERYEKLRKKKGGVATATLKGRSCGACGASLPTAIVQKAREGQLIACPGCSRLLHD